MTGLAHSSGGEMWMGLNSTLPKWFKADLGVSTDLSDMVIYNFNWAGSTSYGCRNVNVYYSNSGSDPGNPIDDPGNWTAVGSAFDLTEAPGADDYGTTNAVEPDTVTLDVTARWVSLKINSYYGGDYPGLSEILFNTAPAETDPPTPDPATFASPPSADSDTAISMTAATGSDATGPVEYYFDATDGGNDSGWQTSDSYTDTGLTASTQYTYTVQMRDSLNNTGTASSPASATTDDPPPPAPPSSLSATAISQTQIDLSWTDNASNETGFKIECSARNNISFAEIATVGQDVTSYSDTTLKKNTLYYYRVRATNVGGDSAYSNEASATTPN